MPSKRYRLKLPHPYAKAGTIIEKLVEGYSWVEMKIPTDEKPEGFIIGHFPRSVVLDWLEEVKEVTCSKEFAARMKARLQEMSNINETDAATQRKWLTCWIDEHTSTEE